MTDDPVKRKAVAVVMVMQQTAEMVVVVVEVVVKLTTSVPQETVATSAMPPVRNPGGASRLRPRPPTVVPRDHRLEKPSFRGGNYVHRFGPGLCSEWENVLDREKASIFPVFAFPNSTNLVLLLTLNEHISYPFSPLRHYSVPCELSYFQTNE